MDQKLPKSVFNFFALQARTTKSAGTISCLLAPLSIFIPGLLLLFFVLPIWKKLRASPFIQRAIEEVNTSLLILVKIPMTVIVLIILPAGIALPMAK